MRARFGRDARVTILGSVSNMPVYLHACDIIYTKPGGLTSTEAAVTEIPIVHTKPIPGCETKNRSFLSKGNERDRIHGIWPGQKRNAAAS